MEIYQVMKNDKSNIVLNVLVDHTDVAAEIIHRASKQTNQIQPTHSKRHLDNHIDTSTDAQILNKQMELLLGTFTSNSILQFHPH